MWCSCPRGLVSRTRIVHLSTGKSRPPNTTPPPTPPAPADQTALLRPKSEVAPDISGATSDFGRGNVQRPGRGPGAGRARSARERGPRGGRAQGARGRARARRPVSSAGGARRGSAGPGRDRHALLGHGVALANRHGVVVERVEVDRDAERGADLVLTTVTLADRLGVVEVDVPVLPQLGGQVACLRRQCPRCATAAAPRP